MIDDVKGMLNSRIRIHDKHRIEIKLDFDLEDSDTSSYSVETYFFIPRSLNVGPHNYHKEQFYDSSQRYIRFSTPKISLGRLCDPALEYSPLTRIRAGIKMIQAGAGSAELIEKICYEIRLMGCIIRGEIRDYVGLFVEEISSYGTEGKKLFVCDGLDAFFKDLERLKKELAALRTEIFIPVIPSKIRETESFFDEYVSLTVEEYLVTLLEALYEHPALGERFALMEDRAREIVDVQIKHRKMMKYPSIFVPGASNEEIIYRRGILKKFISAVLYIRTEFSEWEALTQIVFAFAAGMAMLFAALVSIYFQNRYTSTSVPFIIVLVVSYIFKDRIKDWIKLVYSKKLTQWVSDRKIDVIDPATHRSIGELKEAFTFIKHEDLPPEVERLRSLDYVTSIEYEGRPERVFEYKKEILLYPRKIVNSHARRKGINDIMRFNIAALIAQADDPVSEYRYIDDNGKNVKTADCSRVYHINVVVKYVYRSHSGQPKTYCERRRIVVNKNGIVRMEEVK